MEDLQTSAPSLTGLHTETQMDLNIITCGNYIIVQVSYLVFYKWLLGVNLEDEDGRWNQYDCSLNMGQHEGWKMPSEAARNTGLFIYGLAQGLNSRGNIHFIDSFTILNYCQILIIALLTQKMSNLSIYYDIFLA